MSEDSGLNLRASLALLVLSPLIKTGKGMKIIVGINLQTYNPCLFETKPWK